MVMRMPVIFQINTVVNSGSTGRITEDIGLVMIKNGWESHIAYGRGHGISKSNLYKIGSFLDIIFHVFLTRFFDLHSFGSIRSTKRLIKKIETVKPDIIQLHNLHGYYLNINVLFNFLNTYKVPVFWTFHDCWPITGHCTYFDYIQCEKWKIECNKCPQFYSYPKSLFFDNSLMNFRKKKQLFTINSNLHLIFVSNWLRNISTKSFLNNKKSSLIHNGIDLNIFYPRSNKNFIARKFNIENKFILLGVASLWDKRKGLDQFTDLSRILPTNFQLILIGLSDKQITKLPSNIVGIKRTENIQELAELYSAADVFLNLTLEDNFPTTNIESLACGTPVITFNTGGSAEAIDENTGFVVEKGNLKEVLNILQQLSLSDMTGYKDNCRDRAVRLFDNKVKFEEYFELYKSYLI
jgi:putative colanic acid biosynthesis glycosyltransferase